MKLMQKLAVTLAVVGTSITLAGCGTTETATPATSQQETSAPTSPKASASTSPKASATASTPPSVNLAQTEAKMKIARVFDRHFPNNYTPTDLGSVGYITVLTSEEIPSDSEMANVMLELGFDPGPWGDNYPQKGKIETGSAESDLLFAYWISGLTLSFIVTINEK